MLGIVSVTGAPVDPFRPQGFPTGWEVDLTPGMGNPLPGDPVRIRNGRAPTRHGRVYAVNYATNKLFVELLNMPLTDDEEQQ